MIEDPYEILGVSRDTDMDEIKKAYRRLSRKYHPDANINNPNKDQAEEKFKQIQQAYQKIVDEKEHGGSSATQGSRSTYQSGGYGNSSYGSQESWSDEYDSQDRGYDPFFDFFGYGYQRQRQQQSNDYGGNVELRAAANYINNGYYQESMNVLERISERNGNWYYLHACANAGLGNNVAAKEDAQKAVNLEPNNQQFRQLLSQLESGRSWYGNGGGGADCNGSNAMRVCLPCCALCCCSRCCLPYGFICC